MKTLLRQDFKRLIKKEEFRNAFPEYSNFFNRIKSGQIKLGCCSFSEDLYKMCVGWVLDNTDKWKKFLNTDKIQLYYSKDGRVKRSYII